MNQTFYGSDYNNVPCDKMAEVLKEMPSDFGQSVWPRLSFLLNSRDKPEDIDAKFSIWIPHFKQCWAPLFSKDYEKKNASDPELFKIMNDLDHGENTFYEGWNGKLSLLLRNFIRYYIDKDTNKIVATGDKKDRNKYSLLTEEKGNSYIYKE